jgi:hypothetical protein
MLIEMRSTANDETVLYHQDIFYHQVVARSVLALKTNLFALHHKIFELGNISDLVAAIKKTFASRQATIQAFLFYF